MKQRILTAIVSIGVGIFSSAGNLQASCSSTHGGCGPHSCSSTSSSSGSYSSCSPACGGPTPRFCNGPPPCSVPPMPMRSTPMVVRGPSMPPGVYPCAPPPAYSPRPSCRPVPSACCPPPSACCPPVACCPPSNCCEPTPCAPPSCCDPSPCDFGGECLPFPCTTSCRDHLFYLGGYGFHLNLELDRGGCGLTPLLGAGHKQRDLKNGLYGFTIGYEYQPRCGFFGHLDFSMATGTLNSCKVPDRRGHHYLTTALLGFSFPFRIGCSCLRLTPYAGYGYRYVDYDVRCYAESSSCCYDDPSDSSYSYSSCSSPSQSSSYSSRCSDSYSSSSSSRDHRYRYAPDRRGGRSYGKEESDSRYANSYSRSSYSEDHQRDSSSRSYSSPSNRYSSSSDEPYSSSEESYGSRSGGVSYRSSGAMTLAEGGAGGCYPEANDCCPQNRCDDRCPPASSSCQNDRYCRSLHYHRQFAPIGGRLEWFYGDRFSIGIDGHWDICLDNTVQLGALPHMRVKLANKNGYTIEAPIKARFCRRFELAIVPFYRRVVDGHSKTIVCRQQSPSTECSLDTRSHCEPIRLPEQTSLESGAKLWLGITF